MARIDGEHVFRVPRNQRGIGSDGVRVVCLPLVNLGDVHQCLRRERAVRRIGTRGFSYWGSDALIGRYRRCIFAFLAVNVAEEEPQIVNDECLWVCLHRPFTLLDGGIGVSTLIQPHGSGIFCQRDFKIIRMRLDEDNPFKCVVRKPF